MNQASDVVGVVVTPSTMAGPGPAPDPVNTERPRSPIALTVLATLACLFAAWATRDVLIPLMLAMFLALVGNPIIRTLKRLFIPRFLGSLIVLGAGLIGAGMLIDQLAEPAAAWVHQAPAQLRQLAPKFRELLKPVQEASTAAQSIAQAAGSGDRSVRVVRTESGISWDEFLTTPRWIGSLVAVILLTYFFMVYGESFQRKAISMLPSRHQKRVTAEIMQSIETEVSRYVVTITLINCVVGVLLAAALFFIVGLPAQQALLWGTLAALLNFAPYVGPMIGVGVMLLMGFVSFKGLFASLLPAMLYLGLHVLEGEIVTPIILGRRMAISPLILILALMVCSWLWSIAGLLLAVPMMVCVKIVLSKIDAYSRWASLLE